MARNTVPALGLVALAAVAVALAACSPARVIESVQLLAGLAAGPQSVGATAKAGGPTRAPIAFTVSGRHYRGDLYRPVEETGPALVLVPGVARAGKDDRRLVAFAMTLARARFTVLVPDIANLRALKVRASDATAIADAVRYLAGCGRVGLVAISYGVGLAVIAALRPDIRDRIGFILAIGGYHDLDAVLTHVTTGYQRDGPGQPWRYRKPNAYGVWVMVLSNAEYLADPGDRRRLSEMAVRKMRDLDADVGDLVAGLGAGGRAVHALVTNRDPDRVAALIGNLPGPVRRALGALDLKRRDLRGLAARLILVHGIDDAIIPAAQSRALAAAAAPGRAELHLVDSLAHVDLGAIGPVDALVLWRLAYRVLQERDLLAPPDGAGSAASCAGRAGTAAPAALQRHPT